MTKSKKPSQALRLGKEANRLSRTARAELVRDGCSRIVELARAGEIAVIEDASTQLLKLIAEPNTNAQQKEIVGAALFLLKVLADYGPVPNDLFKVWQNISRGTPSNTEPDPDRPGGEALKFRQRLSAAVFLARYQTIAKASTADLLQHVKLETGSSPDRKTVAKWKRDPAFVAAVADIRSRPARYKKARLALKAKARKRPFVAAELRNIIKQAAKLKN